MSYEADLPDEYQVTVHTPFGDFLTTMGNIRTGDAVREMVRRDLARRVQESGASK